MVENLLEHVWKFLARFMLILLCTLVDYRNLKKKFSKRKLLLLWPEKEQSIYNSIVFKGSLIFKTRLQIFDG